MSENQEYPSLIQQGQNLAKFSWDLINYIQKNKNKTLIVSDETYVQRINICKSCDKYDAQMQRCFECGCVVPAKAKFVLDSCPLNKWTADMDSWDSKFEEFYKNMEAQQDS